MGNGYGRSSNRMAISAMANATYFGKEELVQMQVGFRVTTSVLLV